MNHQTVLTALATTALTAPAWAGYTITQGPSAPTYTDRSLDFDEPGGPTGIVPTDAWASLGLAEMQAGDGVPQVDDWDVLFGPWIGDANAFYGNFGVFMTFGADLTALSCQVWDPAGPPGPFGGGLGVFLFNDGVEVASSFHEPAWGGLGDTWFDIVGADGCVFDEVRILGFGFPATTFADNISWNLAPCYVVTQGASAPTYTDRSLDFDEPGGPTGIVPTDSWASLGVAEMQAGDGVPQVDDWDVLFGPWIGDANAFYGNFGVFMTFDGDLTALSCQVWDPAGPPGPFGGGLGVFLFDDGVEVASSFHEPAWGGLGDSWFDIVGVGGCVFDEVRILGFGFPATTFADNFTWNIVPPVGQCCQEGPLGNVCLVTTEAECMSSGQFISWEEGGTCPDGDASCVDSTPPVVECVVEESGDYVTVTFSATDDSEMATATGVIDIGCAVIPVESGQVIHLDCEDDDDDDGHGDDDSDDGHGDDGHGDDGHSDEIHAPSDSARRSGGGAGTSDSFDHESGDRSGGGVFGTDCSFGFSGGILFIESDIANLVVTATDPTGNTASCEETLCRVPGTMASTLSCPADLDRNRAVDMNDLVMLLQRWGAGDAGNADLTRDARVDADDLIELMISWGPCP